MKAKNLLKALAIAAAAALALVGCKEPDEPILTPSFPEKIVANVAAGEVFEMTIEPNMKWTLKIPTEVATYFKFIVGESERYTLNGEAGTHTIQIGVAANEEFDNVRVCKVEMTMDGKTEVVAELTRGSKERTLVIYPVEYDAEEMAFVTDSEGNYMYSSTPCDKLEWKNVNDQWMLRFIVEANFKWSLGVDTPEWINANKTSGNAGRTEIFLRTEQERLPLEDTTCNIEFCDSSDRNGDGVVDDSDILVVGSYTTTIKGCKDHFEVDFVANATFNAEGEFYEAGSDSYTESAYGRIYSPRGAEFFAMAKSADGSLTLEGAEWINLQVDEFPAEAGEEGIWQRNFTLNVEVNESTEPRYGAIVAIPLSEEGTTNYADYVVCNITQEGVVIVDTNEPVYAYDEDLMMGYAAKFEKLEKGTWPWAYNWEVVPYAYRLTLRDNSSGDDLVFRRPFASYKIYGYEGYLAPAYDPETCWVTINESDPAEGIENGYIIRSRLGDNEGEFPNTMPSSGGKNEATIVFYNDKGEAFALIHVVLDPSFSPFDTAGDVKLTNAEEAFKNGARLEEIVLGDEEYSDENAFMGILQYRLTTTPTSKEVSLTIPEYAMFFAYNDWLNVEQQGSETIVKVSAESSSKGRITFYGSNNYNVILQLIVVYNAE